VPAGKIRGVDELRRELRSNRVVLLFIYDSRRNPERYIKSFMEYVSRRVESIRVLGVDVAVDDELVKELRVKSLPRLRLYLDSALIWEQLGMFYSYGADSEALRFGIRESIRRRGVSLRDLGIRIRL